MGIQPLNDIEAWYLDSCEPVSLSSLEKLGVRAWRIDRDDAESLDKMCQQFELNKRAHVTISTKEPSDIPLNKLTMEHMHRNDEVRYVTEGSGYLDVRDWQDRWIRYHMKEQQFSIVPKGIYHRFLLDENSHFKALRLFNNRMTKKRLAFHRRNEPTDIMPARIDYVQHYLIEQPAQSTEA